jgi:hypothetical protein
MIRLGLQLALRGGREAAVRLIVIVLAVAIGVGLLLSTLAGINAVNTQNARYAWLETGFTPDSAARPGAPTSNLAWWWVGEDTFDGKSVGRVEVAAIGPNSPVPPGIPHLPAPGEYYASPALSTLIHSTPSAELGARYPGHEVGVIGNAALPAPDSLLIVIGRTARQVRDAGGGLISSISTVAPGDCGGCAIGVGINPNGMDLVLGVVALAVLFPVLVFIGAATRLSAARREQRFAAMRLVGATPSQIGVVATVESGVAALAGVAVGFPLFFMIRGPLASIPFTGARFFESDLSLTLVDTLAVAIGIPVAAAIAARVALRRVSMSPLGVTRRVTPKPPRIWRLFPLLAGIVELSYFAIAGPPGTTTGQTQAYFAGFLLIVIGLVVAGPWLTMTGSRVLARRAKRVPSLIAGRRLADNPGAGFRAISGLVLALFVTTVAVGVITTLVAYNGGSSGVTSAQSSTLFQPAFSDRDTNRPLDYAKALPRGLVRNVAAVPGVTGVSVIYDDTSVHSRENPNGVTVVACAQLASTPVIGRCPQGVDTVMVPPFFGSGFGTATSYSDRTWPAMTMTADRARTLPVHALVVQTDGSLAALETARTLLEAAFPNRFPTDTLAALSPDNSRLLTAYKQLANVVILVSLPIAGCSLAVSVAGGLTERKRPFSLLRLSGVPLRALRRVVALETAVPLIITAAVSVGIGLLAAHLFLRAQLSETLQPPGAQYYLIVVVGLVVALAIIASTLPLLRRITGPETARNE